jgi:hypothetical protein
MAVSDGAVELTTRIKVKVKVKVSKAIPATG